MTLDAKTFPFNSKIQENLVIFPALPAAKAAARRGGREQWAFPVCGINGHAAIAAFAAALALDAFNGAQRQVQQATLA